jgi:hypothetical protein
VYQFETDTLPDFANHTRPWARCKFQTGTENAPRAPPIRTPAVAATDTGRLAVGVKAGSGRRLTGRQEPVVRFGCGFLRSKKSAVLLKRSGMSGSSVEHCVRLKDFVHWCVRWG